MTDPMDSVRQRFETPETVAPVPGLAPHPTDASAAGEDRFEGDPGHVPDDRGTVPPEGSGPGREALAESATLPLNDTGNGQRFILHFGQDYIWVPRVGWFHWTGQVWAADPDELAVRRNAQKLQKILMDEIPLLPVSPSEARLIAEKADLTARRDALDQIAAPERSEDQRVEMAKVKGALDLLAKVESQLKDRRGQHRRFATSTGNSGRIENAMKEAGTGLAVPFEDLDAAPLDVNTQSGMLRFGLVPASAEDGCSAVADVRLVPHDRADMATKILPVGFDPGACCPLFDAFLERIQPDIEMRQFLLRWFGLSMTGKTSQSMAFFYGDGANGKSVLVDVIAKVLGGYSATARIESLTGSGRRGGGDATPDLVPLMGARFVKTSEPDEGQRLQEGLIKELTGGEEILVRALNKDFVTVKPVFTLTMSGNHKPEIRGTDNGIWRRVMLVPFNVQIPEAERREFDIVVAELVAEGAGILNRLTDGLIDYLESGLQVPESVREATNEYRTDSDPIGEFLTSACVITGDHADSLLAKDLGEAFNYHLTERGHSTWKATTFAKQIATKCKVWKHPETGRQFHKGKSSLSKYEGIRLTDAFNRRFRDAPRDHRGGIMSVPAPHPD